MHKDHRLSLCILASALSCFLLAGCTVSKSTEPSISSGPDVEKQAEETSGSVTGAASKISLDGIPAYSGSPYIVINEDQPFFEEGDLSTTVFESYSDLDDLGRCGVAFANICKELMPEAERGSIGMVKPSGWHTVKYAGIDGNYLYNRCHLIGYQLAGENANVKNLITGTRYLNVEGMLPFEDMVEDYVKETDHHVLYRVTPIFHGEDLIASGVLMEAESVEDQGAGIRFCVYCYNVQPGITIDYATGDSAGPEFTGSETPSPKTPEPDQKVEQEQQEDPITAAYIGNSNTKKFHRSTCKSVQEMKRNHRVPFDTREEAIAAGYKPCKRCNP